LAEPTDGETAEDLARGSGLSLNEWAGRLVGEEPEGEAPQEYLRRPAAASLEARRNGAKAPKGKGENESESVRQALERLSERMETAESRQAIAIAGIERSVRDVIARIDAAEREQVQAHARFESAAHAMEARQAQISGPMSKADLENEGPRSDAALQALENAIGKMAADMHESERRARGALSVLAARVDRLDEAERATSGAIEGLKSSCTALDSRLGVPSGGEGDLIGKAAENLSQRVEAVREELGRQLADAAEARFDRVEQALARMTEHVRAAEQRSAHVIERMGREVLEVAQNLNRRVQKVEHSSAETAGRMGANMARIATAVEDRLARADSIQAQALEKLGGEIARITERLADRIANSERRSAQAIDDVGEQVARVAERIGQRHERSTSELSERIRQSEERTARLLEEARQRIDERLSHVQERVAPPPTPEPQAPAASEDPDESLFAEEPLNACEAAPEPPAFEETALEDAFEPALDAAQAPTFEDEDFEAIAEYHQRAHSDEIFADSDEPGAEVDIGPVNLAPNLGFDADEEIAPQLASPALDAFDIELELAALEQAAEPVLSDGDEVALDDQAIAAPAEPAEPLTTREIVERARTAARTASQEEKAQRARLGGGVLGALALGRSRRRPGGLTSALLVASFLATVSLSAGGYLLLEGKPEGKLPGRVSEALALFGGKTASQSHPSAPVLADGGASLEAVALSPKPLAVQAVAAEETGFPQAFAEAVAKADAGQAQGALDVRKLAEAGYAPAQFYVSKLYEDGKSGYPKDSAQARSWLARAAEGGDRAAMHNLALDYFEGVGGPRNSVLAAEWFRRAAELGLLDSQFNLAGLYEHGEGVGQNAAEAYKWYLIAARAGDTEAKAAAAAVRAELSPQARVVAEQAAAGFQPIVAAAPAAAAPSPQPDVVTAQRALNQLGYYAGPSDGAASQALHLAIAAYQRDQGLEVTGSPDAATIGKLSAYTR
jgi:localization factor PodJL